MQALTVYNAKITSTCAATGQRWMKVQGRFKMQAHKRSVVVMDVAAFKVSHSVIPDHHATAL
jgi:hypothetical protein